MSAPQTVAELEPDELQRRIGARGFLDRPLVPPLFFLLTLATVFFVGMDHAAGYYDALGVKTASLSPQILMQATIYTVALIAILGTHEMGHWLVARANGVKTSLPVFIPMPFGIGTFGAVIAMKELPPTRSKLLKIGAAGPLAGGVVALVVMALAVRTCPSIPLPSDGDAGLSLDLGESLGTWILNALFQVHSAPGTTLLATPLFFAAWTGFLLTSINLFPIGQLDGGHVAYAILGERANKLSRPLALGVMALAIPGSLGWFDRLLGGDGGQGLAATYVVWGLLLLFMISWHPPVPKPEERLPADARWLAAACVILFLLTFMPVPMRVLW